jgi:hypothetical protein
MNKLHPDLTFDSGCDEMSLLDTKGSINPVHKWQTIGHKIEYLMTRYVEKNQRGVFERVRARTLLGGGSILGTRKDRNGRLYVIVATGEPETDAAADASPS